MTRRLRPAAALAIVALAAVISARCGGTDSGAGTTAAAPVSSVAGGGNKRPAAHAKAVKFSQCMRENGYPGFPEPKASGDFSGFEISVSPALWDKALRACKALKPPGPLSGRLKPEQRAAAREFAHCVRENGVEDFPDPADDEPLADTARIPSTATPEGMRALRAAMEKCQGFVGG